MDELTIPFFFNYFRRFFQNPRYTTLPPGNKFLDIFCDSNKLLNPNYFVRVSLLARTNIASHLNIVALSWLLVRYINRVLYILKKPSSDVVKTGEGREMVSLKGQNFDKPASKWSVK